MNGLTILPIFIIFPLICVFIILLFKSFASEKTADIVGDILALLVAGVLAATVFTLIGKNGIYQIGLWKIPYGINFYFDGLTWMFLAIINVIAFLTLMFSINYMAVYTYKSQFYALFLLMITGMNGVVLSGDFFNMYVYLEIASIASYALIAFGTERGELEAAFKYIVLGSIGSVLIILSIAFLYANFGLLNMVYIAKTFALSPHSQFMKYVIILFLIGFFIKGAIVPFHGWLPDAHPAAPAPVSAMLSGVVIKVLGLYTILRVVLIVFDFRQITGILMIFGIASVMVGSFMMYKQEDIKRMMAFSSISNVGLILLAFSLGTRLGIFAGLLHIIYHSMMKSLLFLNSGAVYYRMHTRKTGKLGGLSKFMPVTTATGVIGSFSIGGFPPFNGFFSKFLIIYATVAAGKYWLSAVALFGSFLTMVAFMRYMKNTFFAKNHNTAGIEKKDVPFFMKLSMTLLAAMCIVSVALVVPKIRDRVITPAVNVLMNKKIYWNTVLK